MGLLDKFLDAIKLNDDDYYDDEDDFLDDDFDDDYEDEKPKRRFFKKSDDDFDDFDDYNEKPSKSVPKESKSFNKQTAAASSTYKKPSSKVTPMRKKGIPAMEVNVIRPTTMEDAKDIAETLMGSCTVILNLEGLDIDIAQRIIDFTCGACFSLGGSLQKISAYIYILTPAEVDISGDYQEILNGALDSSTLKRTY